MTTKRILHMVRLALMESIREGNTPLIAQQSGALILAMKDHIDFLEKQEVKQRLFKRYRKQVA